MITEHDMLTEIPGPPKKPLVGNALEFAADARVQSLMRMAREYGPIYRVTVPGRNTILVSGYDLVDELCNEKRFDKKVHAALKKIRDFAGDGLFTAYTQEPNWHKAHNILLTNFSQRAMQGYHASMLDIAEQLMHKWERLNADEDIDVPSDMTRLTLDTIGLCGFDYRFNSFYRENLNPFVESMVGALHETMAQLSRLPIENKLLLHKQHQYHKNVEYLNTVVDTIIRERRESGVDLAQKKDLLSYMLMGVDKQSGEKLDDLNIRYQIITFLIAGHETTSGLLSFATYFIMKHPEVQEKLYAEVDRVLGPDPSVPPTYQQVLELKYTQQVLKEALRLWPTAPAFGVYPYEETVIGGKYKVTPEDEITVIIPSLHRDKLVWGDDVEEFNPERFTREREAALPPNAYKPFGNGQRACIGRQFAMQEATLVLGMMMQRFKLVDVHNYELKIKETLTLKPDNFHIKVLPREESEHHLYAGSVKITPVKTEPQPRLQAVPKHHTPLLVLFGSNMGTSEELAQQIAEDGELKGFDATVAPLDDYANHLPKDGAIIITTASYNGTPPDNAVLFCDWLKAGNMAKDALQGVKYTVFGCGNRDWAATFQAIPRLIDEKLAEFGATRMYQRGEGDASEDFDGQFQDWYEQLWETLSAQLDLKTEALGAQTKESLFAVEVVHDEQVSPVVSLFGARPMQVVANFELQQKAGAHPSERSTRHIELALPDGMTYTTGDHLGIIPRNDAALVKRVATRFGFDEHTKIRLHKNANRKTLLPVAETVAIYDLLATYVELQDVATRKQISILANHTQCPPEKKKLEALSGSDEASVQLYKTEVLEKRRSLIDLLEECPACELPFNLYLEMLPAIRPRYYSISSSPARHALHCSITVAHVTGAARSGNGTFAGVCSTFLAEQPVGSTVNAFIQETKTPFRLPADPATPLIMVGPGTGLAPYRGFLQERAAQQAQGITTGEALLFFGCRHPEQDFIYEQELQDFAQQGLVRLYTAFSRVEGVEKCYVQHRIHAHRDEVWQLIEQGACIYICGDASHMAPDVRCTLAELYQEKTGRSAQEADQWLAELTDQHRYQVDVWAGN